MSNNAAVNAHSVDLWKVETHLQIHHDIKYDYKAESDQNQRLSANANEGECWGFNSTLS